MAAERLRLAAIAREASAKAAHVVLAARCPVAPPPNNPRPNQWFHLVADEGCAPPGPWADVRAANPEKGLVVQVLLDGEGEDEAMLIEEWRLGAKPTPQHAAALETPTVYKRLVIVIRSLYTLVHALPGAAVARAMPSRVRVRVAPAPTEGLEADAAFATFPFAEVASPVTTLAFEAVYRTEAALADVLKQAAKDALTGDVRADWLSAKPLPPPPPPAPMPVPQLRTTPPIFAPHARPGAAPLNTQSGFHLHASPSAGAAASSPVALRACSAPASQMPRVPSGVLSEMLARRTDDAPSPTGADKRPAPPSPATPTAAPRNAACASDPAALPPLPLAASSLGSPNTPCGAAAAAALSPPIAALPFAATPPSAPSTPGLGNLLLGIHGGNGAGAPSSLGTAAAGSAGTASTSTTSGGLAAALIGTTPVETAVVGGSLVRRSSWRETPSSAGSAGVGGLSTPRHDAAAEGDVGLGAESSGLGLSVNVVLGSPNGCLLADAAALGDAAAVLSGLASTGARAADEPELPFALDDVDDARPLSGAAPRSPARAIEAPSPRPWTWARPWTRPVDEAATAASAADATAMAGDAALGEVVRMLQDAPSLRGGAPSTLADALQELTLLKQDTVS